MIEKSARPRRIVAREYFRTLTDQATKRSQKFGATFKSDQRIRIRDLKTLA